MAATTLLAVMQQIVQTIQNSFTRFTFMPAEVCRWSAEEQTIYFVDDEQQDSVWGLMHELGHGLLQHTDFTSDMDLLEKEVAAWEKAHAIARQFGLTIESEHIDTCLDSYRDWLSQRSTCPTCGLHGIQTSDLYRCLNCTGTWRVSANRFCRTYRRTN